jgi:AcrR family transcriptional regulator
MGRPRTIDRDRVLDVADLIVGRDGAAALTIEAVASAAGISKGGVQSCFGSKEALVAAMLRRWMDAYDRQIEARVGAAAEPTARVAAHVDLTRSEDDWLQARAAGLLAVLLQRPEHLGATRDWYRRLAQGLDGPGNRQARLALLATEGAFFLRFFDLLPMTRAEWEAIFADIATLR